MVSHAVSYTPTATRRRLPVGGSQVYAITVLPGWAARRLPASPAEALAAASSPSVSPTSRTCPSHPWVSHTPGIVASRASRINAIVGAVAAHTLDEGGAMASVSHRGAWSPVGSVRQVAQFLGVCRNAFEQIGLILPAALDPTMAHRARRGECVTGLDHCDPLQTARNGAIWICQVFGPLVTEDLRCCHARHREVTQRSPHPGSDGAARSRAHAARAPPWQWGWPNAQGSPLV
jgi:hypothetical protein